MILSRLGEGFSAEGLPSLFTRGGSVVILMIIAWRRPMIGGVLLLIAGLSLLSGIIPFSSGPMWVRLLLAGPPLVLGGLFIIASLMRPIKI
jgi:hypothetical protein